MRISTPIEVQIQVIDDEIKDIDKAISDATGRNPQGV